MRVHLMSNICEITRAHAASFGMESCVDCFHLRGQEHNMFNEVHLNISTVYCQCEQRRVML